MRFTNTPMVSVVMATYNRANIVGDTIRNIYQQDYESLELIVINDASKDNTLAVLKQLQQSFNFKLLNNPKNLGLQKSLNRGLQIASGKYIARIDDHDRWIDIHKITKQVDFMECNPEFGLVGTAYQINGQTFTNPLTDKAIRGQMLLRCPFCHVSVLIRKSILEKIGTYDEGLTYAEDWDLWLKIGSVSKIKNLPDVTVDVFKPVADESLSGDNFLKQFSPNRRMISKYLKYYPGRIKAVLYHKFVQLFFAVVPLNGCIHNLIKKIFQGVFLRSH